MEVTLPKYGTLNRKAKLRNFNWSEDSKNISVDLSISYHDDEGKHLDKIPNDSFSLHATGGKFRDAEGNRIEIQVDENGVSIIPEGAISDFEFFKSINGLANQIIGIIEQQIQEAITENRI